MIPPTLELETGGMCLVPGGEFLMGSDDSRARDCERPAHKVHVGQFYVDRTMVTNSQFSRFCDETRHRTTAERMGKGDTYVDGTWQWVEGACWRRPFGPESSVEECMDHPVVLVSVGDALAYCRWRIRVERRRFRLPTEAEWEKAARGTDGRTFPWGEEEPDAGEVQRARFNPGQPLGTAPVGAHPAGESPYGLLDMAGNAWDWCLDAFDENRYRKRPERDNGGPLSLRPDSVFKGGSWIFPREALRSSGRHQNDLVRPSVGIGFRTVHPLQESTRVRLAGLVRRVAFGLHRIRRRA